MSDPQRFLTIAYESFCVQGGSSQSRHSAVNQTVLRGFTARVNY